MSAVRGFTHGEKISLRERQTAAAQWDAILAQYRRRRPIDAPKRTTDQDELRWLAAFALREICGWRLDDIASVIGRYKGTVARIVAKVRRELREQFEAGES